MDVKCCSCCKLDLPKHQFYADKRSKDGLTAGCKKCHAEKAGKVYGGIRNKDIEVPDGYKRCSMCQEILPLERFSVSKNKKSGYQSHCKECRRRTRGPAKSVEILPAGTKRCWDCREILEANEDHFAKSRSSKDGLQGRCKKCSVAYRQRNRDRILKQKKNIIVLIEKQSVKNDLMRIMKSTMNSEPKRKNIMFKIVYVSGSSRQNIVYEPLSSGMLIGSPGESGIFNTIGSITRTTKNAKVCARNNGTHRIQKTGDLMSRNEGCANAT